MLKYLVKNALGLSSRSGVSPPPPLVHLGSRIHGYHVPVDFLRPGAVCYCVGAGDNISFDAELAMQFDAAVFIFDPSPEGKLHYESVAQAANEGAELRTGPSDPTYTYRLQAPHLARMTFVDVGIWSKQDVLRFHKPTRENYDSHSIVLFQDSKDVLELPVDKLANVMRRFGHGGIDLLKLEIEGAEYEVLRNVVSEKLDVKVIAVEYDEIFHAKDGWALFRIRRSTKALINAGYKLVHSTPLFKRLFIRNDVYERLRKGA